MEETMEETKSTRFMDKLQKVLMPIGNTLSNQRHIKAISAGLMSAIPLTIIGAVAQIFANPPITPEIMEKGGFFATLLGPWFRFAQANQDVLMVPYNMTMGLFSLVVAFAIAYQLAKYYKMDGLINGIIGMIMFVMITAPIKEFVLEGGEVANGIPSDLLGSPGMFAAIIVGLVSVELSRFVEKKNLVIKLPDVVPPSLAASFNSMIPLLVNVLVIYGLNMVVIHFTTASLPELIIGLLMAPLKVANSIPGMLFLVTLVALLWVMGIHGTMIVYPIIMPFMIEAMTHNAELVASGKPAVFAPVFLFGSVMAVGGTGNTLGLVILGLRSKSEQIKAISKVSIVPGIFGINEPVIFGMPIMYNPILAIPYVLSPVIFALLSLFAYKVGLLVPAYIFIATLMPIGVGGLLGAMSIRNFIYAWAIIPVSVLIYYPFFKVYERQLVAQEKEARQESEVAESEMVSN